MPPRKRAAAKTTKAAAKTEEEPTPIADQVEEDLRTASEEDLTHFPEDDDPLTCVGELVDEGPVND